MSDPDTERAAEYWGAFQDYMKDANETALTRGYELARRAMANGCGVLEMAAIHHQALRRLRAQQPLSEEALWHAERFLAECLSPFEMSHRGIEEGTRALHHVNDLLEDQVKRIAHALHDEAGQLLASVHIALAGIAAELPPRTRAHMDHVERLLRQIEVDLRNLSHELRPTLLDNLGLVAALEFLADRVAKRSGLSISVAGQLERRLPAGVETALYRIVQEALNNTVKHARASEVSITLRYTSAGIACGVHDNGRGFDARGEAAAHGLGLLGIRERLHALGGSLAIETKPQSGTTLVADIPLGGSYALPRVVG